jgi:hypothetical protein
MLGRTGAAQVHPSIYFTKTCGYEPLGLTAQLVAKRTKKIVHIARPSKILSNPARLPSDCPVQQELVVRTEPAERLGDLLHRSRSFV